MKRFSFANRLRLVAAPLLAVVLVASAFAANVTATIRGTVTDPNGAVVPNVTVTAVNEQTGVTYNTTTQQNGTYQFLQLPVGRYSVNANAPSFQKFSAKGITLNIDQQYVQNISLKVGNNAETIEVQANAVQVDTSNIQLNNVVDANQVVDLPLIGRNFTQLETIFPGVQSSNDRFGTYSANGSQSQQSSFLINGTDINDAPLNTAVVIPSPDAIQQFNLITSSLNAEYSRNSGAIVSVNIKNGTNKFHGDAFDFYRDTFLNTPNWFQKLAYANTPAGLPKSWNPVFHQNIFGGTVGGPILRDKMFFFLSYQGTRARSPQATTNNIVYTPAQLSGTWGTTGFSSNPIPSTISVPGCSPGQTWSACATALGGVFPTSAFNATSVKLVQQYVPASATGNYIYSAITNSRQDQGIMRFDLTPHQSDSIWFTGIIQHSPSIDALPFTGSTLPGFGENAKRETKQFTTAWTHTFNSTTLNEFRLGYTRFNFGAVLPNETIDPQSYGFNINTQAPQYKQMPTISLGNGWFTLGFSTNGPQPRIDQTYQISDNFSKIFGNHTAKFGFDGREFKVDNPFYNNLNGSYSFGGTGTYSTGNPGLDFLLGIPDSYGQGSGAVINAYAKEAYLYAQDQWKVKSNLTLTLGVGWQIDTPWHNRQYKGEGVTCYIDGKTSSVFPGAPVGLNYPSDKGCNDSSGATTDYRHVGPRVGFAWAPSLGKLSDGQSHKLSIRGGFGIYFNRTEEEGSLQNLEDPPYGVNSGGIGDLGGNPQFLDPWSDINGGGTIANKFPASFPAPPATGFDWTLLEPFSISQYAPGYVMPYSMNYNLTIERELPSNIVATFSYVGSQGRHEQITHEGNYITQAGHDACLADAFCKSTLGRTYQGYFYPDHTKFGNGDIFGSIGYIDSIGNSNYNSLQLSAKKGFSHGLMFQASYTWSHALDNGSGFENSGFGGAARGFNIYVPSLNYGDSAFDARHRFVFAPVYQVPNLKSIKGMHWLPDAIGKGWGISGILTHQTGFPIDVRESGYNSLYCWGYQYYACPEVPVQIGNFQKVDPHQHLAGTAANSVYWFNPKNVVMAEPIGTFGNVHRNPLHGPGFNNTDVSIVKDIHFSGDSARYVELRLESYNVFNHTNFGWTTTGGWSGAGGSISSTGALGNFGKITSAGPGRQTQLAVKFYF